MNPKLLCKVKTIPSQVHSEHRRKSEQGLTETAILAITTLTQYQCKLVLVRSRILRPSHSLWTKIQVLCKVIPTSQTYLKNHRSRSYNFRASGKGNHSSIRTSTFKTKPPLILITHSWWSIQEMCFKTSQIYCHLSQQRKRFCTSKAWGMWEQKSSTSEVTFWNLSKSSEMN